MHLFTGVDPHSHTQYHTHVGRGNCTVVDTYWQTETGGHIATNFPGEIGVFAFLITFNVCADYSGRCSFKLISLQQSTAIANTNFA